MSHRISKLGLGRRVVIPRCRSIIPRDFERRLSTEPDLAGGRPGAQPGA